ncbi:capsule biosynthesis protein [Paragemmobacter straminiformis]|uniref:Capsular biosynthesis protein n=1 Tax=Paragemmobacter straminiformis TaxID=2045119 RepID=A0A842IC19_9RHOB|nr:capsular biosynthesis protein [Gemmobacter straminiformis]MBC2837129.1 capsular biosynthesis protein [Gemmobacter straminiformis]
MRVSGQGRHFLLLQGPHGPFFGQLGAMLRASGATVHRAGFNRGDHAFWPDAASYIPYRGTVGDWPATFARLVTDLSLTDIVLYGDTRPLHAAAIAEARKAGLTIHVFEEGYLRPYWVTYERGGSNGHSRLMHTSVAQMQAALAQSDSSQPDAPAHWGDMRQHMFWGALYHWFVFAGFWDYRAYRPHREITVWQEAKLHLRRLLLQPLHRWQRKFATARIRRGGYPYHIVLLQLEHDASFRAHSPFSSMADFAKTVIAGFAAGAPPHHHLVFKAHPLEDDRTPLRRDIRAIAARHGLAGRVHVVRGGKLAQLLDHARSAVTVNSTAGQQALWRGLPLRAFGQAVYAKPEFVSTQDPAAFFAAPTRPDARAYRDFRRYLLETSQIPGGFYAAGGRRALLRQVVDLMLAAEDPYDSLLAGNASPRQQFYAVN